MSRKPTPEAGAKGSGQCVMLPPGGVEVAASPVGAVVMQPYSGGPELPLRMNLLGLIDRETALRSIDQARRLVEKGWKRLANMDGCAADNAPDSVWRCWGFNDAESGFLVTMPNELDVPVAFIATSRIEVDEEDALEEAWSIAEDHCVLDRPARVPVMDLRQFGRPGSREMTPGFLYGLFCVQVDRQGKPFGDPRGHGLPCNPFCPVRLREMQQYARDHARMESGRSTSQSTPDLRGEQGADEKATAA